MQEMKNTPAENSFQKGLIILRDGDSTSAMALFESALRLERERGAARPQMKYLSYYGLAQALAKKATPEAIKLCETAANGEFFNPELQHNLGKVYLLAGKTTKALEVLERARKLSPGNKGIRQTLADADRRGHPPIAWLRRDHPINIMLGRWRYSMYKKRLARQS